MCYVFNCFGWALDFLQRAITFALACILCFVVGVGLLIAIAAGIAYGYNYSMAEFLTFTRQDVTVYMRRGQFYDHPQIDLDREPAMTMRRSGGEQEDLFGTNRTADYEDRNPSSEVKSLHDSWGKVKDTRKYADVLTKYSSKKTDMGEEQQVVEPPEMEKAPTPIRLPVPNQVEVTPNPAIVPTTLLQSGTSQIVMRKFQTVNVVSYLDTTTEYRNDNYFYQEPEEVKEESTAVPEPTRTLRPLMKALSDKFRATQYIPMRHWDTTKKREASDEVYAEEVDEDNLVYKMKSV